MKLKILASGSSGNCYILENNKEALIIEAGVPFSEVKRALDYNVMKIVGAISSHGHNDHNKYLEQYENSGISSWCFGKGFPEYDEEKMKYYSLSMGKFRIKPFPLVHDVPCYGFYITHPDMGKLVFITDTEYVKKRFVKNRVNHIMVEANYSNSLVDRESGKYEHQITGHMEIDTTCRFIEANRTSALRNVILLHLSENSADAEEFKVKAEKVAKCPVYVAQRGLEVDLKLTPF